MANRRADKNCVDIRVCLDEETNKKIIQFQAAEIAKTGKVYHKWEAASDYFMQLAKK